MAAVMKFFLVIVALVCCMQFVEMARLRREDAVATPETFDFATHFNTFVNQIKDSDLMKQLQQIKPEQIQEKFQEGLKTLQENFETSKDKFESFGKEIVENFNKKTEEIKN